MKKYVHVDPEFLIHMGTIRDLLTNHMGLLSLILKTRHPY